MSNRAYEISENAWTPVESSASEIFMRRGGGWPSAFLQSTFWGSSGIVILVPEYVPYLPHVGTSPAIVDNRSLAGRTLAGVAADVVDSCQDKLTWSAAEKAQEVMSALSLNKSQLAEVLRISRPTLYEWLDGKEPNSTNYQRLVEILRLLERAGIRAARPLNARFVRQRLSATAPSLLEMLSADFIDSENVCALLSEAQVLGEQAAARREAREARLRALGFEEQSDKERRNQLAKSVALRDWPKPGS